MKTLLVIGTLMFFLCCGTCFADSSGDLTLNSVLYSYNLNNGSATLYCDMAAPPPGKPAGYQFMLVIDATDGDSARSAQKALQAQLLSALATGRKVQIDYNDQGSWGQMFAVRVMNY